MLRLGQKVAPEGTPLPGWRIASELALRLGTDFDLESPEEIQDEIARVAPAHSEVDAALLRRARDGAVLPVEEHRDLLVLDALRIPVTDASWEPILSGTILEPATADDARDADGADAATAPAPPAPALFRWTGGAPFSAPPLADGAIRLVAGRRLYDAGRIVTSSPPLVALPAGAELLVHPDDASVIGAATGDTVRVRSGRGTLKVPLRIDARLAGRAAFLAFNQPGPGAADLIDSAAPVTDIRVEVAP